LLVASLLAIHAVRNLSSERESNRRLLLSKVTLDCVRRSRR
jgi:hypothetical protein